MFVQAFSIIAANIYREGTSLVPFPFHPFHPVRLIHTLTPADDKPRYLRGNRALVALSATNIGLYLFTEAYYVLRNKNRDRKWKAMSEQEKEHYLATTTDLGNERWILGLRIR
jgi:hypothetical protein